MRKTLLVFIIGLAMVNALVYLPSCGKEEQFVPEPVNLENVSTDPIPDEMVVMGTGEIEDRVSCNGTLTVTKLPCSGCGGSDMKFIVEVMQRCANTDPWVVTHTIPCSALNGGTFPITLQHERKLAFRMSFKNVLCGNHPNWQLQANVTIRNANNTVVLSANGQNGPNTWDIFAQTTGNVFCPGLPIADSCL